MYPVFSSNAQYLLDTFSLAIEKYRHHRLCNKHALNLHSKVPYICVATLDLYYLELFSYF